MNITVNDADSLQTAIAEIRTSGTGRTRKITLNSGHYFLENGIGLDPRDSGLTLEAAPNAEVVLIGGRKITNWEKEGSFLYAATLPGVKEHRWDFRALVVNGRLADRSRLPRTGRLKHLSEFKVRWMSTTAGGWQRKPTLTELTTLKYRPEDLGTWLDLNNAELTIYHIWDESVVGLAGHDPANHALIFSNPAGHPPGAFGVQDYVVWNVREGMAEPGQWYLDRTKGRVVYWPLPAEDMTKAEVIAPTVETILRIAGTSAGPVKNLTLRGLTLSATTTPLIAGGFGALKFAGAITATGAEDCRFSDLRICQVGGHGIKAAGQQLTIENCRIHDTGAGGVILEGQDSTALNNHIHHVGVIYPSAIALWGHKAGGIKICHNEVHDTPYTAIACTGNDNDVEANLIYRSMEKLKDGAGIYITFCKNIAVRGNFIRDISDRDGHGAPPSAYYLDEQAEGCLVEGNLALNVAVPSHNHMAVRNILRNNVFMAEENATLTFAGCANYDFERNVVCAAGKLTFTNPQAVAQWRANVLFSAAGLIEGVPLNGYAKGQAAPLDAIAGCAFADPQLSGCQTGKIVFAPTSPAHRLGITPIDVSSAGLTSKKEE